MINDFFMFNGFCHVGAKTTESSFMNKRLLCYSFVESEGERFRVAIFFFFKFGKSDRCQSDRISYDPNTVPVLTPICMFYKYLLQMRSDKNLNMTNKSLLVIKTWKKVSSHKNNTTKRATLADLSRLFSFNISRTIHGSLTGLGTDGFCRSGDTLKSEIVSLLTLM